MTHRIALALALSAISFVPTQARAHGLFGHVHVTGWAIENLPPGELRDMFRNQDVRIAAWMGATFPDTGYALGTDASRAYGEHSHWEPFIEDFIEHVKTTYGPTYDTVEEQRLIAFLMGCGAHGLQDELFDSTFLYEAEEHDGHSQEATDPGTDGFLVLDGHARLYPEEWIPMADILPLYADLGQPIDEALITKQVRSVLGVYVNDGFGTDFAAETAPMYAAQIPWTRDHYLDPSIPGSLRAEIAPTAAYMQAIWDRLHDRYDESNLVIHTWPDAPRRLRSADHTSAASWVTVVFGQGVLVDTITSSLTDANGTAFPYEFRGTRWNTRETRLVRFQATSDYAPGETYTATIHTGASLIAGGTTTTDHAVTFQVECTDADDPRCPPLPRIDDPTTEPVPPSDEGCSVGRGGAASPLLAAPIAALLALGLRRRRRSAIQA